MAKFTLVDGGERGAPRKNTSNRKGTVRITVTLAGVEGNITRSLSIQDATVSAVYNEILETLVKQPA